MKLYSTNNKGNIVSLEEAVLNAFPKDRGLYMPTDISKLSENFFEHIKEYSFIDIAFQVASNFIGDSISNSELELVIEESLNFEAPLVNLNENFNVLELFHGPTLAFKDFGARFMASLIGVFMNKLDQEQTILVATSGDTGGAVASGFYNVSGVNVVILFPKGKVSFLQQQQLTTLGKNISAIEIDGTFDDCQRIVKDAFLDKDLNEKYNFSSANSINIARLIPQSFYYFESYKQLDTDKKIVYSVPSGNLGNLTAGLFAKRMGLGIDKFIASTNSNHVFHDYIQTGLYKASPSVQTISNAMDVGDPSNFYRILDLYSSTWNTIKDSIDSITATDIETKNAIQRIYTNYNYIADPHTAVAYIGLERVMDKDKEVGVFLSTAHPSKFIDVMEDCLNMQIEIPDRLDRLKNLDGVFNSLTKKFEDFKEFMLSK